MEAGVPSGGGSLVEVQITRAAEVKVGGRRRKSEEGRSGEGGVRKDGRRVIEEWYFGEDTL